MIINIREIGYQEPGFFVGLLEKKNGFELVLLVWTGNSSSSIRSSIQQR